MFRLIVTSGEERIAIRRSADCISNAHPVKDAVVDKHFVLGFTNFNKSSRWLTECKLGLQEGTSKIWGTTKPYQFKKNKMTIKCLCECGPHH